MYTILINGENVTFPNEEYITDLCIKCFENKNKQKNRVLFLSPSTYI